MAKVDQTKANALLRAARTMSLGANKNTIRILYGNHVAENIDFERCKTKLKKVSGAGANAQITAEPFLLLLMSQLTILVLIQ
ncbi:hypothetical protein BANRA_04967 [Escherichia coli]|nr:hypothetical protein BANRA_04967 [Escherichia coli]